MKTSCSLGIIAALGSLFPFFTNPAVAAPLQVLHGNVPPAIQSLTPTGNLPETNQLRLAIALPLRSTNELAALLRQIYDPASPNYHHYLTPEQFAEQFGPTEKDYQTVAAFARANGLRVTATHLNRVLLDVSGSAAEVEHALHVKLLTYRHPTENRTFYAPDTEPSLDLAVPILHISGLDNYSLPRPRLKTLQPANGMSVLPNAGSGPAGSFMGKDFRAAYAPGVTLNGTGQTVGLLQFDGYTSNDITYYESQAGLPAVSLTNVLMDGATGDPSGSGGEIEVSLDIEMAISMATNLSKVIVYEAPNPSPFEDLLSQMANDNLAKQLSCSWFIPGGTNDPAADVIFQQMAAQGQSFFNASGDGDAYTGLIDFPGDTPYITQVGGTTLTTSSGKGASPGSYVSETVWNWGIEYGRDGIGSGGGISTQYPIPNWQTNISMASNQGSTSMRNTPDVAMTADHVYVRADGFDYVEGGTSCAAPLWAGFMALVNQEAAAAGQPAMGFINPALDAIGTGTKYTTMFHDITTGNNTWSGSPSKFYATSGYDLCTGWGTPTGQKLIDALALPEFLIITPSTGFTSTGGQGGPFTVTYVTFTLTNAGTNSLSWTVANPAAWLTVSPTSGTLAAGGPVTNVTVSLNTAASNLVAGTYSTTIWFTNLNDNVGQGRQFTLNVISPPAIMQQPTNTAVLEGATAIFNVTATGGLPLSYQWQDNGTNLTDGGNISGSTTPNLVISSVSTNNVGTYTVTVTNVAGSVTSSNAMLTITPSAPVIVVQPTNQTVVIGQTASFGVVAIGTTPMTYQWTKNGTNLLGATGTNLTIVNAQTNDAGTYAVALTNSVDSATSSNAVLTVLLTPPCLTPPSGLVSWWPAEGNANDIAGVNNGVIQGGLSFTNGEVGQAFLFTNTTATVQVAASPSLNVGAGGGFTIEGWVNPTSLSQNDPIVEWNNGSGSVGVVFYLNISFSGNLYANIVDSGGSGGTEVYTGAGVMTAGVFQHVAVTYDKTSGVATLYRNGTVVAQKTIGSVTPQTSYNMYLGRRPPASGTIEYSGLIDEVSLYNRALSSSEIAAIYNAGSIGKCAPALAPTIIIQPTNQMAAVDGAATFTVAANGSQPLFYQWNFNGTNIDGATNTSLTLTNIQTNQAGNYAVLVANAYGSLASSNATLTVGFAPSITTQPVSSTNVVGTTATFSVTATGSLPLTYQWKKNGVNISGAADTNLVIASVTTNDAGLYSVAVTNAFGSVLSSNATLTVLAPPVIIVQPSNQTVVVSNSVSFSVVAAGNLPLFYQWNFNGTNIANATNSVLLLTNVQFSQAGNYAVLVTNAYGSALSSNAVLTVNPPPSCHPAPSGLVSWWPGEGTGNDIKGTNNSTLQGGISFSNGEVGQAFLFNTSTAAVQVAASPSLNVGAGGGFTIEGWVNPTSLSQADPIAEWNNGSGSVGVVFYLNISFSGNLYANIVDSGGSGGTEIYTGSGVITSGVFQHVAVTYDKASGVATLYRNGTMVAQKTIGSVTPRTSYDMYLGRRPPASGTIEYSGLIDEVSLYNRALSSSEIAAIYNAGSSGKCPLPPTILSQPTNQTVMVGATASFSVTANGSAPLFYQWAFGGTNLLNATNSTLALTNVQFAQAGTYAVQIANAGGSTNSVNATLTVNGAPVITTQPVSQTNFARGDASFTVAANGTAPLSYQWNFVTTNINGATNVTLTLTNLALWQSGNYAVRVTNIYGSVMSSNAPLVVNPLFHFVWNAIPSPRFIGTPFAVSVQAQNPTNGLAADFTNAVSLLSTNGIPVSPVVSGNFIQGVWTGAVVVAQTYTNLVLEAMDTYGESGLANSINVVNWPPLTTTASGNNLYIFWPIDPAGFVLETSPDLLPTNWVPVGTPPLQIGGQNFLPLTMSGTNAFYRLRFTGQ